MVAKIFKYFIMTQFMSYSNGMSDFYEYIFKMSYNMANTIVCKRH